MANYASLNQNNIVVNVYVGRDENNVVYDKDNNEIDWELYYKSKRTSYNTRGGIHYQSDNNTPSQDQSKAFRKNYAGIGYTYDEQRDAFIPPKPYPSWVLDEFSCLWNPPIPYPNDDNMYMWNESTQSWDTIN